MSDFESVEATTAVSSPLKSVRMGIDYAHEYEFVPALPVPEDFAHESFPVSAVRPLHGLALPILDIETDFDLNVDNVLMTASSIAERLEHAKPLKAKLSAAFWRGIAYEYQKRTVYFDPAIGDVGRLVRFPSYRGSLISLNISKAG